MTAVISLNHVAMQFPALQGLGSVQALEDVNFEFRENEFVVALGASGCGKTTLLNVIAGFLAPTSGEVLHKGEPVSGPGRDRGVVFQKHALLPWFNVVENTEFGLKLQGVPSAERRTKARENLALVGLSDFENYPIYQLSGGMQQRVGLARALTCDPDMLLMDEPSAPSTRSRARTCRSLSSTCGRRPGRWSSSSPTAWRKRCSWPPGSS